MIRHQTVKCMVFTGVILKNSGFNAVCILFIAWVYHYQAGNPVECDLREGARDTKKILFVHTSSSSPYTPKFLILVYILIYIMHLNADLVVWYAIHLNAIYLFPLIHLIHHHLHLVLVCHLYQV